MKPVVLSNKPVEGQAFDPANHPAQSVGASPIQTDQPAASTEINIDPSGHLVPAASVPGQTPDNTQTLAIPGASLPNPTPPQFPPQQ